MALMDENGVHLPLDILLSIPIALSNHFGLRVRLALVLSSAGQLVIRNRPPTMYSLFAIHLFVSNDKKKFEKFIRKFSCNENRE